MGQAPISELLEALAEGLARPQHFWTVVVVLAAIATGMVCSRLMFRYTEMRLADDGSRTAGGVDALRFSIEGARRLAFPVAGQIALLAGEGVLRASGVVGGASDVRLLRLAMTLFGAMAVIRFTVYVMRRAFGRFRPIAAFERVIAAAIWVAVALHLTGWLADVVQWMEATALTVGKTRLSLWTLAAAVFSVIVTLLSAFWIGAVIEARVSRSDMLDVNFRAVLSRIVRTVLVVLAVLLSLSAVGIDLTVLSVFGGALGVGLGLGLQRIASNYVSGFIILLDRSLHIGDLIAVDKYYGKVARINTRYTVIAAPDGTEAIVPNEMLVSSPVTNHTYTNSKVRLAVKVAVAYGTDVGQVLGLMAGIAAAHPRVQPDPPPLGLLAGFGADGLELELGFWINDPEEGRANVQSDISLEIYRRFQAAGIVIPFPQREIRLLAPAGADGVPQAGRAMPGAV
jgi:small-conductance mechanosensitive channel